ncbi:MAG: sigma-70 family RNA polymerase sigma factor [Usitatibacter sp.]
MTHRVIVQDDADESLVERYREGDREAFATLVRKYQRPIFNAAYRVLGRDEDASDVTQAVFLKVAERLDQYDAKYKFFSWIYRIAVNESLNLLRDKGREEPLDEDDEPPALESADPAWQLNEAQVSQRIHKALMAMRVSDRMVLTLRHFGECSYQEMSDIMGIDVKTVKSRLFEARARLREPLADLRVPT